jgi:hypothetical protein
MVGLVLLVVAGCKKRVAVPVAAAPAAGVTPAPAPAPAAQQTTVHAPTGVVIQPGLGGGGSGGAAQAVRKAVLRTVTEIELKDLHLYLNTASLATGQLPTKEAILADLRRDSQKLYKQIQDGSIVLTGATSRDAVWAYTAEPQRGNDYYVVTSSGVDQMNLQALNQRLGM